MNTVSRLIKKIKKSDKQAFHELFDLYQQDMFNFLYYKLGNTEAAEDILQDVFVKVWHHRKQLRHTTSIKSFLFTIANRLALNYLRHNRIVMNFQMEQKLKPTTYGDTPYLEFEQREIEHMILQAIQKLPEQPRIAFMLSRFDELSYKEIAERLNISIKTVETHIGKALKSLRSSLQTVA